MYYHLLLTQKGFNHIQLNRIPMAAEKRDKKSFLLNIFELLVGQHLGFILPRCQVR